MQVLMSVHLKKSMDRRHCLALLAGACAASATRGAIAQSDWPSRPLKCVVPYPPGASTDQLARIIGAKLAPALGQSIVIENRGGAGGSIGTEFVAKSPPDGYTFMVGTDATHAGSYHLSSNPPYHPINDFTTLTIAASNPIVLVAHPSLPVKNLRELLEYGRAHPEKMSYGSSGTGTPHHLAGELMRQRTGVPFVHVSYRGGGPALNDVLGGQILLIFSSLITVLPHIKSGKLTALGITQAQRYPGLPDVPSIGETIPGFELDSWLGFFAPAGMPDAVTRRLSEEIIRALHDPEVKPKLEAAGLVVTGISPAESALRVRRDFELRGTVTKAANIKAE